MKALTLTQPWATLVAIGAKRIETRSWSTDYRGPLVIHAAKGVKKDELLYLLQQEPFASALRETAKPLPLGAVVATCELVACLPIRPWLSLWDVGGYPVNLPPGEPELSFGDYRSGRFAWVLANVRALPEPIPAKGALGLWEWQGGEK